MKKLDLRTVNKYIKENIDYFHQRRILSLSKLKLQSVLQKKNPYLFKAKNVLTAGQIVKGIVDAFLSSKEETIFGDFLEGLAIFICGKVYKGKKSAAKGIDLEFDKERKRYIVSIKSGANWGNGSQIKKLISDFNSAKKTLRTNNSKLNIVAVNGCCYGRDNNPDKNGIYYKYCGQKFWEFISENKDLYIKIIEPLGYKAKEKNDEYLKQYSKIINKFTKQFIIDFCNQNGSINWGKIVKYNSAIEKIKI
jgi:hypothetical protein